MGEFYYISLFGPFDVADNLGNSVRPAGKKECAIIALLACSPQFRRSRNWVKSMLWSDRGEAQASASLRQTLWRLRRRFGHNATELLKVDRDHIWLDRTCFEIVRPQTTVKIDFLEGLDIRDEAFEDWLREQRASSSQPSIAPDTIGDDSKVQREHIEFCAPNGNRTHLSMAVLPPIILNKTEVFECAVQTVLDQIVFGIRYHNFLSVFDFRDIRGGNLIKDDSFDVSPNATLEIRAARLGNQFQLTIWIRETSTGEILGNKSLIADSDSRDEFHLENLSNFSSHAIDLIHHSLLWRAQAVDKPTSLFAAVHNFFSVSKDCHDKAKEAFSNVQDTCGVAHAWLAYSQVVAQAERLENPNAGILEKVHEHCVRAIEMDPSNPIIRSIVGHINAFAFRNFEISNEHFEIAKSSGPNIALVWSLAATQANYLGQTDAAFEFAKRAKGLSQFSPYKFFFDADQMFALTLSGDHKAAIKTGEDILNDFPGFLGVMRHLAASYSISGDISCARRMIHKIQESDPQFTRDGITNPNYPLPSTESVSMIQHAFKVTGVT